MGNCCGGEAAPDAQTTALRRQSSRMERREQRSAAPVAPPPEHKDIWAQSEASRFKYEEVEYNGRFQYYGDGPQKEVKHGPVSEAKKLLEQDPHTYVQAYYQSDMADGSWPEDQQQYTMVKRAGSVLIPGDGSGWTLISSKYEALQQPLDIPIDHPILDQYQNRALAPRMSPGRGQGLMDIPGLKIWHHARPTDVKQGSVGDCWLLSGFAALAEYPGAIAKIFRHTEDLADKPGDALNEYKVALYNLETWEEEIVTVNESLCCKASGEDETKLQGARPSNDGELWVCMLEKAVAAHVGGWDRIDGGQCTHAWRLLTGNKEQYTITSKNGEFHIWSEQNANTGEWPKFGNSPHDISNTVWPCNWPNGKKGAVDMKELFRSMCEWDDAGYLMAGATRAGSDTESELGIVDGHAYTVLDCHCLTADNGDEIDILRVRNPWGHGEFTSGKWDDDGPGWTQYPEIKAICNPVEKDDGIFFMSKEEFFGFFKTVYLCCSQDMWKWGEPFKKKDSLRRIA